MLTAAVLAAVLAATPYALHLEDGRTRQVVSHSVIDAEGTMAVIGEDAEGRTYAYRLADVDLAATEAAETAAERAAEAVADRAEVERQKGNTRQPPPPAAAAPRYQPPAKAGPAPAAASAPAAGSDWTARLSAMRARWRAIGPEYDAVVVEHNELVKRHNRQMDRHLTEAGQSPAAQRIAQIGIAEARSRMAALVREATALSAEYKRAQEEARRAGAPPPAWNRALSGGAPVAR